MEDDGSKKRTIDERIDALTMNLELLSHSVESMRETMSASLETMSASVEKMGANLEKMRGNVQIVFESVAKLAMLADNHDTRIANLEHPQQ